MLAVTVPAINRPAIGGLERNFSLSTAVAALYRVHLPRSETTKALSFVHSKYLTNSPARKSPSPPSLERRNNNKSQQDYNYLYNGPI
jgi:hypothetical protein